MVTIAHLAKQLVKERMLVDEYLKEGIINYIALAKKFKPRIENELGKKVKVSTIAMALRRYAETAKINSKNTDIISLKGSEVIMKGSLCDIAVYKSPTLFQKLKKIYGLVNYNKGDTLNIIHGNYDVAIIINESFRKQTLAILEGEKVMNIEQDLVALTIKFGKKFLYIPGITFSILKQLVLENINLIEIISSLIEITFIINKKDATKGYRTLQEFIEKS